jgi:hypothetical protein
MYGELVKLELVDWHGLDLGCGSGQLGVQLD